jgi:hypothetical protein
MKKLTRRQKKFAVNCALGMNGVQAAKAAGYADSSPQTLRTQASRLTAHPDVQREAFLQREKRLQGPLAQKALACLENVLEDSTAPAAARVAASRFVLEACGHGIESRRLEARIGMDDEQAPHRMTLEALEAAAGLALAHVEAEREKSRQAAAIEAVIVPADGEEE